VEPGPTLAELKSSQESTVISVDLPTLSIHHVRPSWRNRPSTRCRYGLASMTTSPERPKVSVSALLTERSSPQ